MCDTGRGVAAWAGRSGSNRVSVKAAASLDGPAARTCVRASLKIAPPSDIAPFILLSGNYDGHRSSHSEHNHEFVSSKLSWEPEPATVKITDCDIF